MKQKITDEKKTEPSIKRLVSDLFLKSIDETIKSGVVKNRREFAARIHEEQKELSMIQNPDNKRFVDFDMLYNAVNELDYNANYFLVKDGDKKEELFRGNSVHITGGTVHGDNAVVLTGQAVSQTGDVYFQVKKLIQGLPEKDKKAILEGIASLNTDMNSQIEALKKTIAQYEREFAKDELIIKQYEREIEKDQKIITLYEQQQQSDKKIIEAQEKRIKALEQTSSRKK